MLKLKVLRFLYENNENRPDSIHRTIFWGLCSLQLSPWDHLLWTTVYTSLPGTIYLLWTTVYTSLPGTIYCGLQSTPLFVGPFTEDFAPPIGPHKSWRFSYALVMNLYKFIKYWTKFFYSKQHQTYFLVIRISKRYHVIIMWSFILKSIWKIH